MTLEGEYYDFNPCSNKRKGNKVAILMTLEGEYYTKLGEPKKDLKVAILMTLEGEYYPTRQYACFQVGLVAILMTLEGEYYMDVILKLVEYSPSQSS